VRDENPTSMADGEVYIYIGTAAFMNGSYCALIVQVDHYRAVPEASCLEDVCCKFDSKCLELANVPSRNLLAR
jgi:hypothetical protein